MRFAKSSAVTLRRIFNYCGGEVDEVNATSNNIMFGLCVKIIGFILAKCGRGDMIMFGKCGDVCETAFDGRAN